MAETKKVGSTGRFGSRYGVGIRKRLLKVEPKQLAQTTCPNCNSKSVKRKSKGIFQCKKCNYEFVGGAYLPKTLSGNLVAQMVSQKGSSLITEVTEPKAEPIEEAEKEE